MREPKPLKRTGIIRLAHSLKLLIRSQAKERLALRIFLRGIDRLKAGKSTYLINPKPVGDCFAFRETKGMVSYMPAGKPQAYNDQGKWVRAGRQDMKPARWMRGILSEKVIKRLKIKDGEFAVFEDILKVEESKHEKHFEFVSFQEGYDPFKYVQPPPSSCMWGYRVWGFYDLFGARCLVMRDGAGQFHGRAVVWNVELTDARYPKYNGAYTFMDRVYTMSTDNVEAFKQHARSEGWIHKHRQSKDYPHEVVYPDGQLSEGADMTVTAPATKEKIDALVKTNAQIPYLDTFLRGKENLVANHDDHTMTYCYRQTGGTRHIVRGPRPGWVQAEDGGYYEARNTVTLNGVIYSLRSHQVIQINYTWHLRSDCAQCRGGWYVKTDPRIVFCPKDNAWERKDIAVTVDGVPYVEASRLLVWCYSENRQITKATAVNVKGQWFPHSSPHIEKQLDGTWDWTDAYREKVNPPVAAEDTEFADIIRKYENIYPATSSFTSVEWVTASTQF